MEMLVPSCAIGNGDAPLAEARLPNLCASETRAALKIVTRAIATINLFMIVVSAHKSPSARLDQAEVRAAVRLPPFTYAVNRAGIWQAS
jgi:hypothetical protein